MPYTRSGAKEARAALELKQNARQCARCKEVKPLTAYGKSRERDRLGLSYACKACGSAHKAARNALPEVRAKRKAHYEANKAAIREAGMLASYGVTREQYEARLAAQDGKCAICLQPETGKNRSGDVRMLSVDHDHRCCPGKRACSKCIRGLLCSKCNLAIGLLSDDRELLLRAAEYLAGTSSYRSK